MSGLWKPVLLTLVLSRVCLTQAPPPKTRVEGKVTNQAGQPLANATVVLAGINGFQPSVLPPAYTATSNSSGDFTFDDVEQNTYRFSVQRPGYLDFVYAEPNGRGDFPIAQSDQKTIDVKMTAPSFLSGKITTEDGEPFPDARITVYRVRRVNGKQRLDAAGTLVSGADGHFSTGGLRAGRFYLAASTPPSLPLLGQREIGGAERYVTTYYPSALDTSAATLIDLPSETELSNIDIRVRRSRVFHISGKVVNSSGTPVPNPIISLLRPTIKDVSDWRGDSNRVYPAGEAFQVNGLLPGLYAIRGATEDRRLQGHLSVTVLDHDLDDVVLTLAPALGIPISVRIVDADEPQAQTVRRPGRFTLTATDGINDNEMAWFNGISSWLFRSVGLGTYRLGLAAPEGTYVKSVRFGDQDITNRELDTSSGVGTLEIALSPHPAEVNGALQDSNGQPLAGVTVTLWRPGPPPGTVDQARSTRTDTSGKFHFGGLAPGEYRVAAWERIDPDTAENPEFLAIFDDTAAVVKLSEDSRETVQPVLISRDKVEAEAAKLH